MTTTSKSWWIAAPCLALLAWSAQDPSTASTDDDAPAVDELYARNCSHCHTVPDPAHETDRAWLSQVHDTA